MQCLVTVSGSGGSADAALTQNDRLLLYISSGGAVTVAGSLSKGSGSFKMKYPLEESMEDTHHLVHSFVEKQ